MKKMQKFLFVSPVALTKTKKVITPKWLDLPISSLRHLAKRMLIVRVIIFRFSALINDVKSGFHGSRCLITLLMIITDNIILFNHTFLKKNQVI